MPVPLVLNIVNVLLECHILTLTECAHTYVLQILYVLPHIDGSIHIVIMVQMFHKAVTRFSRLMNNSRNEILKRSVRLCWH